jgi:uncharacterized protein HemX
MFGLLTTKVVGIGAAILLALLGAWGGWQYIQLQKAKVEAVTFKAERDEAGVARDKALEANSQNQVFIAKLQQEKIDIQSALNTLEARKKKDAISIDQLSKIIQNQTTNPENQVKLSPVLKAVLDQIQKTRVARGKDTK